MMSDSLPVDLVIRECGANDYSHSPLLKNSDDVGIQLLCNAALGQGLQVKYHRKLIFEVFNDDRRIVFRQNSPENSAVYTYCARQKHLAKDIMAKRGVPVPTGGVFDHYGNALRFFQISGDVVTVKPSDGSSGSGVTSGVSNEEGFDVAWRFARKHGRHIIVEQNIFGQDIRVIVIAGKAEAAYVREPAHVVGNGKESIRELVDKKNSIRKRNPSLRTDMIKRFDLLEKSGVSLDFVPAMGEKIQLTSVANASAGGETVQILDHLNDEILEIAERAAKCFPGLVQVGVDLILRAESSPDPDKPKAFVIEVNSNPGICDAVFPGYGRSIDIPGKLISHMFSTDDWKAPGGGSIRVDLAGAYHYQAFERAFRQGVHRQVDLIVQAACMLNLTCEPFSDTVFALHGERTSQLFHDGMPEGVRMVSRKTTRNREWLDQILPKSEGSAAEELQGLRQFRLLVVGRKLVASLMVMPGNRGQESIRTDISDLVHHSVLPIVDRTLSAIFDPPLVGIDLYAEDISQDLNNQRWYVGDAVCNPQLGWHHFPDRGVGRNVAMALVRAVFPQLGASEMHNACIRLLISGDVQGVGFRSWLKLMAVRHGVSGWARNCTDGRVEAVLEGTPTALAVMERFCQRGPEAATVEAVEREEWICNGRLNFAAIG